MPKPQTEHEPEASGETARELSRLHLEVLVRMVCERAWEPGGPSLAGIWRLLPNDPRKIGYAEILAVLEKIGMAPQEYFFEVSRESTKREITDMKQALDVLSLRILTMRPPASDSDRPSARSRPQDVSPIVE